MGYRAAKRHLAEHGPGEEGDERVHLSKSEFFRGPLGADAIAALVDHARDPRATLDFSPWGGAYNRVAPDATAFPHRRASAVVQLISSWRAGSSADASLRWLGETTGIARKNIGTEAYANYVESDFANWQSAYYGANYPRLQRVKREYDPDRLFDFPQAIEPA
jgi:FAD/FMN-containing dehydrogenase